MKKTILFIIAILMASCVFAINFKPNGNILGSRTANNSNATMPFWNISGFNHINQSVSNVDTIHANGQNLEIDSQFVNFRREGLNTRVRVYNNSGSGNPFLQFRNDGTYGRVEAYNGSGSSAWVYSEMFKASYGDIDTLTTVDHNSSNIWLYGAGVHWAGYDDDHIQSTGIYSINPNASQQNPPEEGILFGKHNDDTLYIGGANGLKRIIFDTVGINFNEVDSKVPFYFNATATFNSNIYSDGQLQIKSLRVGNGVNGVAVGTMNSTGSSTLRMVFMAGNNPDIDINDAKLDLNNNTLKNARIYQSTLSGAPSECPTNQFMTYFNLSHSVCSAPSGISGQLNWTGCNMTFTNGLLTSFEGCESG